MPHGISCSPKLSHVDRRVVHGHATFFNKRIDKVVLKPADSGKRQNRRMSGRNAAFSPILVVEVSAEDNGVQEDASHDEMVEPLTVDEQEQLVPPATHCQAHRR